MEAQKDELMNNSNIENEQMKQVIEGFTCLMRGMWNNPNLTVLKYIAEKYNIDKKFCEKEKIENNEHSD